MRKMKIKSIFLAVALITALCLGGCAENSSNSSGKENASTSAESSKTETNGNENENDKEMIVLTAYSEILKSAPAIEGDPAELYDASFGYEKNQEKFGNHIDRFALFDMNQDGIPELITLSVINFRWTNISVYTYADDAVVLAENKADSEIAGAIVQRSTANGAYDTYFCSDNYLHSVWSGKNPLGEMEEERHVYALEGTSLVGKDCSLAEDEETISFFDIAKPNTTENVNEMLANGN